MGNLFKKSEKQHFSIRKFYFGAASVLLGLSVIFGNSFTTNATTRGISTRALTPEVRANALQTINKLSNLSDIEKQYYITEINRLTKGVINHNNQVQLLLDEATKLDALYKNNRGTSEADAIENPIDAQESHTISGNVRLTYGGPIGKDADSVNAPLKGVEVYAQWYEGEGLASPIYKTTTKDDGSFSIGMNHFIGANGKKYTFNAYATKGVGDKNSERWRIWTKNPDTGKYTLLYSYGEQQISPEGSALDTTAGATNDTVNGRLSNVEVRYAEKTDNIWKEGAVQSPAINNTGGSVEGSVYWNNKNPQGNLLWNGLITRESSDLGLANVDVYASYLSDYAVEKLNSKEALDQFKSDESTWDPKINDDRSSNIRSTLRGWNRHNEVKLRQYILDKIKEEGREKWIAETIKTKTDANGHYKLQFNGTFGQAWNDPGFSGAISGRKSVLLSEEDVTGPQGVVKKGKEWKGEVAPSPEYGKFASTGVDSKNDLTKAPKHINLDWMMVTAAAPGISFTNAFYGNTPKGSNGDFGTNGTVPVGPNWGVSQTIGTRITPGGNATTNVNFAAFHSQATLDIFNYDSFKNFANPGDTANAKVTGLNPVGDEQYELVWKDQKGNIVSTTGPVKPNSAGELHTSYKTPENLNETTTYFLELYALDATGKRQDYPMQVDSYTAVYKEIPKYKNTAVHIGQKAVSAAPTFDVAHTTEVETKSAPQGATFALVAEDGKDKIDGVTIDKKTGVITWDNPTGNRVFTVEVTYSDGTTAITEARFTAVLPNINVNDETVTENQMINPISVSATDVPPNATLKVTGLPQGLTYTSQTGKITGTPIISNWEDNEQSRQFDVKAVVEQQDGTVLAEAYFKLTVKREQSNVVSPEIKNIDDQIAIESKAITPISVEVTNAPKNSTVEVTGLPNGVTYDATTKTIKGTPSITDWKNNDEETRDYTVKVSMKDENGKEVATKQFKFTIQRDTDKDGTPDVTDDDDDNDGISDIEEKAKNSNPKDATSKPVSPKIEDIQPRVLTEKQAIAPIDVKVSNLPEKGNVEVEGLPEGLTYDKPTGKIIGTPQISNWMDKESRDYQGKVVVKDKTGAVVAEKQIRISVLRDTDGDGLPDVVDQDDDDDGFLDVEEQMKGTDPKDATSKPVAPLNPMIKNIADSTVVEHKPIAEIAVEVTNKPTNSTVEVSGLPTGLTYDATTGKITGTPAITDWSETGEAREHNITISVKDEKGQEITTKRFKITVQRDTDKDGNPDVTDLDDDNDGVSDADEINAGTDSKDKNSKPQQPVPPTAPPEIKKITNKIGIEKQAITPIPVDITNKPADSKVEVTGLPAGLTYDAATGKITGTPTIDDWKNNADETRQYNVKVALKDASGNELTSKEFKLTVYRDTDGDGYPDETDPDDDGDGVNDKDEIAAGSNPKDKNSVPAVTEIKKITNKVVVEKQAITETLVEVMNQPANGSVEVSGLPNGVTYDPMTKTIKGTPTITNWGTDEIREHIVKVDVKDASGKVVATQQFRIAVQRDTDGDKTPDIIDTDDDNDGFTDVDEIAQGTNPKDATSKPKTPSVGPIGTRTTIDKKPITPINVHIMDLPPKGSAEVEGLPEGLTYDAKTGKITGTPKITDWQDEETREYASKVVIKDANGKVVHEQKFGVIVARDTDGDGIPDTTDTDDDNDGYTDDVEIAKGTNPKDANSKPLPPMIADINNKTIIEKQPINPIDVNVTNVPSKGSVEVTGLPNGLVYDSKTGKITGTPIVNDWGMDKVREYTVKVSVKDENGKEVLSKEFKISIQRKEMEQKPNDTDSSNKGNNGMNQNNNDSKPLAPTNPQTNNKESNTKNISHSKTKDPIDTSDVSDGLIATALLSGLLLMTATKRKRIRDEEEG